jgi:hypothetical protein
MLVPKMQNPRLFYSHHLWCIYIYSNTFYLNYKCGPIFFLLRLKCVLSRVHKMHIPPIFRAPMVFLLFKNYDVSTYILTHMISTPNFLCFILFLFSLLSVCSLKFTKSSLLILGMRTNHEFKQWHMVAYYFSLRCWLWLENAVLEINLVLHNKYFLV